MEQALEKQLLDLETQFWNCMKTRDVEAALKLTHDPCIVTGAQGVGKIDRQIFAKMMETGTWTLHHYSFSDVKVERLTEDVAVIGYKVRETLTVDGQKLDLEAADASTWVRKDGKWRCALHTESVIGDPFGRDRKPAGS